MCLYNNYEGNCNMKRKRIVFGTLIGALALSVSALVGVNANNKAVENKAAAIPGGQLYVQVRNADELRIGDTVMFGSDWRVFTYLAGNPIFSCGEAIDGHNEDYTKYYFASSDAIPWVVEHGVACGTYSFRSIKDKNLEKNYSHPTNGRYLAYGHNYSGPGYSNIQAYGDINTSGSKNNDSSWTVKFSDDGLAHVQRYGEPLQWQEGAEPGSFTEIQYIYYGSSARNNFGYYQNSSNFKIFRKVDLSRGAVIHVEKSNNESYTLGQTTDLTGLEITVALDGGFEYTCTYANEPDFFEALPVAISYGARFTWCGFEAHYYASVTHDTTDEHRYTKSNNHYKDARGEYVLGFDYEDLDQFNATRIVKTSLLTNSPNYAQFGSLLHIDNPIIDNNYEPDHPTEKNPLVVNNIVKIVLIDGDYYIKIGDQYLFNCGEDKFKLDDLTGNEFTDQLAVVGFDDNNHILFGLGSGMLVYDTYFQMIRVVNILEDFNPNNPDYDVYNPEDHIPIDIYRLELTDNLNLVESFDNFMSVFFQNTAGYDPTGQSDDVTASNWSAIRNAFTGLDLNLQGYLGGITYTHNHTTAGTVYQLADIYDSLLLIHEGDDGFDEFMGRNHSGALQDKRSVTLNGEYCTISGYTLTNFKNQYVANIEANVQYHLPEFVEVLMGGIHMDASFYSYVRNSARTEATLTINANVIVDNVVINVVAVPARYIVTYVSGEGSGQDYVTSNYEPGTHISILRFNNSGFIPPAGKRFLRWEVSGVQYLPGDDYVVNGDVTFTAIYETISAIDQIENHTSTTPYLSYEYTYENGNYTFSDVMIRFRGIISVELWNEIDALGVGQGEHNILGYGALLSTDAYLNGVDLKTFYASAAQDENVKNFYVEGTPTFLAASQYDEIEVDSYSWNLRKAVGVTADKLTRTYVALTYVLTANHGPVFLSESKTSVKDIASSMMINHDESYRDGSLNYLANIVA